MRYIRRHLIDVEQRVWPIVSVHEASLETPLRLSKPPTGESGAPFKHGDDQNVGQAGVTNRTTLYDPNTIGLQVRFGPVAPGPDALDRFLEYRDGLGDGRQLGEYHVESVRGGVLRDRFQVWRLAGELSPVDVDALLHLGRVDDPDVMLRSDESWWREKPIDVTFTAAQFVGATIANIADEAAWPYYELTGPITSPRIGLHGESVLLPNVAAGQTWTIDTDPNWFSVKDHTGLDRTWPGRRWYQPAKRRTPAVPLTISGTGTTGATKLRVVLAQMFRSPF